ncbi:sulfatase-like hydrolase/transferase [Clostridium sediminicola]|uniref:sulfatase-like hydrolase/transferase n=1 Tax=Clostridium sediminicola TaxID=3114879 RepID=UPI003D185E68
MLEKETIMKPNIVLINCDDLGYGDLGCYGSKKNDTPYLDKLAEEGIKFNDFYMASPVCSPSRGAMMTGCYPPRIGFGSFHNEIVLFPGHDIGLNPKEITIARVLKDAGYNTMHIGKWHCGDQEDFLPTNHGFDDYYGLPFSNDMARTISNQDFPPLPLLHGKDVIQQQPDQISLTERYTEKSVEFIRDNQDNPFFLYLAHMHVHLPLYAPEYFVKKSRNGDYGACVMAIDWSTGVIVEALKKYGLYENTIIIFTSDNGSRNDFGESNGIFRGGKRETWEGGLRVPFIVHWKGKIEPSDSDEIITSLDIYPSLAKISGAEIPQDRIIDGMDLSDLMLGKTKKSKRDTFFYYLCNCLEAARVGDWKLHVAKPKISRELEDTTREASKIPAPKIDDDIEVKELYNLREDPSESNNVYNQYSEIAEMIMEKIEKCRKDIGDAFTDTKGENIRDIGKVEKANPLTEYDENHPYIISMYDKTEVG